MRLSLPVFYCLLAAFQMGIAGARDYGKETPLNQFRPHGGDRQEIGDFIKSLAGNVKRQNACLASDSAAKASVLRYLKKLAHYQSLEVLSSAVEKFYTVARAGAGKDYRAMVRFAFRGVKMDGRVIEHRDYLGLAKLGKKPGDWKLWGVIWQDSGVDVSDASLAQLEMPAKGEEICVMATDAGVIRMRLFPNQAPKAVRNFKALAVQGFYDNKPFLRVFDNFMVQGGALDGTKEYEISSYGRLFEDEFNRNLFNFRGALCMGNGGPDTNGNQFYIVQSPVVDAEQLELCLLPLNARAKYQEIGGRPYLDMRYTVFGQVFEGIEAVDKIARQKADGEGKPLENPMKIQKIVFESY